MRTPIFTSVEKSATQLLQDAADRQSLSFDDFIKQVLQDAANQEYALQQTDTARTEGNA